MACTVYCISKTCKKERSISLINETAKVNITILWSSKDQSLCRLLESDPPLSLVCVCHESVTEGARLGVRWVSVCWGDQVTNVRLHALHSSAPCSQNTAQVTLVWLHLIQRITAVLTHSHWSRLEYKGQRWKYSAFLL